MTTKFHFKNTLEEAYQTLRPFSNKYKVDFDRFLFTLETVANLNLSAGAKVLDIGTGIGLTPLVLKKLGFNAEGVDTYIFPENNNEMFAVSEINRLQEIWRDNNLKITNQNLYKLTESYEPGSIDLIISEAVIEHLKDPKKFLTNCQALLKEGGVLLISTPNIATLLKRVRFLFGKSPNWPVEEFFAAGEDFTGHWREYTLLELAKMCELSGFQIVNMYNKNLLTKFKGLKNWRKNLRAVATYISCLLPNSREMVYVLAKKLEMSKSIKN